MFQKKIPYCLLLFPIIAMTLFSCVPQKKVATTKSKLTEVDIQLQQYGDNLKKLETARRNKEELNEIDDTASARLQKFISNANKEIDKLLNQNSILIGDVEVDKADWEQLKKSLAISIKSSKKIGDKVLLISDLISRNTVIKIDQDVFFEPGQYTVTPTMATAISKLFEPPAKEIDLFMKKYPEFPLYLIITAKGYADATPIAEGTALYKDLKEKLNVKSGEPDNKELNKQLSRVRAREVIELFKKFSAGWAAEGGNIKNIAYMHEGKGEALPNPKLSDYKTSDPRRRVVLLYWSVFPDE